MVFCQRKLLDVLQRFVWPLCLAFVFGVSPTCRFQKAALRTDGCARCCRAGTGGGRIRMAGQGRRRNPACGAGGCFGAGTVDYLGNMEGRRFQKGEVEK